jgi:uncharacterized protein (DUF924 family)
MNVDADPRRWCDVLDFWFPERRSADQDAKTHGERWCWRMRAGADSEIMIRFQDLTARGAAGDLDAWASAADGRLALIIVLDQFSRSLWRGTPRAFAQDAAARRGAADGAGTSNRRH